MTQATIYTSDSCPYCVRAKNLLRHKGITFEEINIFWDDNLFAELTAKTGMVTLPQIWIGDTFVGGCNELYKLESEGKLDEILINSASPGLPGI